ncbi:MAG: hypothetical protein ACNA70_07595 [Brevefilum sp.]
MSFLSATLVEILQLGPEIAGRFDLPAKHWPLPGQYLACQRVSDDMETSPVNLFPVLGLTYPLTVGPIPATWQPGDQLVCTSPQGHGFNVPVSARRVGLVPYRVSPARLMTLVTPALAGGASVALFYEGQLSPAVLDWVPSQVEVLPLSELVSDPGWPDYLAVDVDRMALEVFFQQFERKSPHCEGEVLVRTPMPCRGLGACGVCSVHTRRGWRLACADGPVFALAEVCHVA